MYGSEASFEFRKAGFGSLAGRRLLLGPGFCSLASLFRLLLVLREFPIAWQSSTSRWLGKAPPTVCQAPLKSKHIAVQHQCTVWQGHQAHRLVLPMYQTATLQRRCETITG